MEESGSESTRGRRRGAGAGREALFGLEGPGAGGMGGMDREVRLWDGAALVRCCSAGLVGVWSGFGVGSVLGAAAAIAVGILSLLSLLYSYR